MTALYQWHKIRRAAAFAMVLFIATVLSYCVSVIITAYIDTPKVIARATSPDQLKLRLEEVPAEYQRILLAVEDPSFYSHQGIDFTTPGAG